MTRLRLPLTAVLLALLFASLAARASGSSSSGNAQAAEAFLAGGDDPHNNWAVLVCSSRYWFNYRHIANTLSMYRTVKRLGIPDENILLMLADDVACNARNAWPAKVINNADARLDLYGGEEGGIEVDYRGYEVTAEAVVRVLTDRLPPHVPRSKRLLSDAHSRVLVFMTGHGGDGFLKFQDNEELGSHDLADAFAQMHAGRRYKEILFMIDTCQANTMYEPFTSPRILAAGSSAKGENSYSHHMDATLGVAVIDRFTYYTLEYLERLDAHAALTAPLLDMFRSFTFDKMASTVGVRTDLWPRANVTVGEFFGGSRHVRVGETSPAMLGPVVTEDKSIEEAEVGGLGERQAAVDPEAHPQRTRAARPRLVGAGNMVRVPRVNEDEDSMRNRRLHLWAATGFLVFILGLSLV